MHVKRWSWSQHLLLTALWMMLGPVGCMMYHYHEEHHESHVNNSEHTQVDNGQQAEPQKPIDQIIWDAMQSPQGFDMVFDAENNIVRYEMDILAYRPDYDSSHNNEGDDSSASKRQAIKNGTGGGRRWTRRIVPYEIDSEDFTNSKHKQVLQQAMQDWMKYTCIVFREATQSDQNKIKFVDGDGCASFVGMQSSSKQNVYLADGCRHKGTVIHELGHALGLQHEQTRPDRDQYVKIHLDNIPDNMEYNFKKYGWSQIEDVGVPYDYTSIMHYGKTYFAENPNKLTIETKDPKYQDVIGNRQGLSFRDIKTVNLMYNCTPTSNCNLKHDQCEGEGFVGKDCKCWCPAKVSDKTAPYVVCSGNQEGGNQGGGNQGGGNQGGGNQGGGNQGGGNQGGGNQGGGNQGGGNQGGGNQGGGNQGGGNQGGGNQGGGSQGGGNQGGGSQGSGNQESSTGCMDMNSRCEKWAKDGECNNTKFFMGVFCRKACNLCRASECDDLHKLCGMWKDQGYCSNKLTPLFMGLTCPRSCGKCTSADESQAPEDPNCKDKEQFCAYWATDGKCDSDKDRAYMRVNCQKSCDLC